MINITIKKVKLLEFVRFDSKIASACLFVAYLSQYFFYMIINRPLRALEVAGAIYRHINFQWARNLASKILKNQINNHGVRHIGHAIRESLSGAIDKGLLLRLKQEILSGKPRLFDKRLLILSNPVNGQKGVIILKFTDYFKYFVELFDVEKIAEDYVLIVEPSSVGLFDFDLLCLMHENLNVIVEAGEEPIDIGFINDLNINMFPVEVAANCWVDERDIYPIREIKKKYDIIMVSLFAYVKRHYHLFESLGKCNRKLKVALVGTPWPRSLDDMKMEAAYYGVIDQVSLFSSIPHEKVNKLLNESKLFLLLSKKEGYNKASIESMFANTPAFYLDGYNYGNHYSYVNSKTGGFIHPKRLPEFLNEYDFDSENQFNPYEWVHKNMTPETSTEKIINVIGKIEKTKNISVNKDLAVKVNSPELEYKDDRSWVKYAPSYRQLKEYLR